LVSKPAAGLRSAVFLDRDGVLNEPVLIDGRPHPPVGAESVVVLAGAADACRRLRATGVLVVVVTNQPDIARRTQTKGVVDRINATLREQIELDAVFVCPHDDSDGCSCRKPQPGMLTEAAWQLGIDLQRSVMVGDRWRDVEAGRRAGCATVLVRRDYDELLPESADLVVGSLSEAIPWILCHTTPNWRRNVPSLTDLRVKVFADGADEDGVLELAANPLIKGFTTNPSLMRSAGVADYEGFARRLLQRVPDRPFSFEVFADEFDEMARQARQIASWGASVYVKIPVTNTRGESSGELLRQLAADGVRLNVTALLTLDQVRCVTECLAGGVSSFISVFAGRIADTGRDPLPLMCEALAIMAPHPHLELIWASPREILNVIQADEIRCHVITVTHDLLKKLPLIGKDLGEFSLDTVRMFHRDAKAAGYHI
jgi:transaldolase